MTMLRGMVAVTFSTLVLAGCTSSPTATSSTPTPTAPQASSTAATSAAGGDPLQQWCAAYAQTTQALVDAPATKEGADTSLKALTVLDQLWQTAPTLGYVTQDEAAANRDIVVAYGELLTYVSQGSTETSADVIAAKANLDKVSLQKQDTLDSSASKVSELCRPFEASASPSPS
jgi:uncharacterized lipoprotein YajG